MLQSGGKRDEVHRAPARAGSGSPARRTTATAGPRTGLLAAGALAGAAGTAAALGVLLMTFFDTAPGVLTTWLQPESSADGSSWYSASPPAPAAVVAGRALMPTGSDARAGGRPARTAIALSSAAAASTQVPGPTYSAAAGTVPVVSFAPGAVAPLAPSRPGTIFDRRGMPLATSDPQVLAIRRAELAALGLSPERVCPDPTARCYPLGGATFHVLRGLDAALLPGVAPHPLLKGEDPRQLRAAASASSATASSATPAPGALTTPASQTIGPDVFLTLDAGLQLRVVHSLERRLRRAGLREGAAVVLRPATGEILAMVSTPYPTTLDARLDRLPANATVLTDRARAVPAPPGSTFKLVTAMAAMRRDPKLEHASYRCVLLEEGRVGAYIPQAGRAVRDDVQDQAPHGDVRLEQGIQVSCNAFFAQLAVNGGLEDALVDTAAMFGIRVGPRQGWERMLEQAAFGQGPVRATPLQMALVAASIANRGRLIAPTLLFDPARVRSVDLVSIQQSETLARGMRKVVQRGTAKRALRRIDLPPIAGKTGTAEIEGERSHAWFIGFSPYPSADAATMRPGADSLGQIAVAVFVPHGGYGGDLAAPIAGDIFAAAYELGVLAPPSATERFPVVARR